MSIDSTLYAGLQQPSIRPFWAVQIQLPLKTINLLSGSGYVTFNVNGVSTTFTNRDPDYGIMADIDPMVDGVGKSTSTGKITIYPPTKEAIVALLYKPQGSMVLQWMGLKSDFTGEVIGTPTLKGYYYVNQGLPKYGAKKREVAFSLVSGDEWCFRQTENCDLNLNFQAALGYGDNGLKQVIPSTDDTVEWGGTPVAAPQGWIKSAGTTRIG